MSIYKNHQPSPLLRGLSQTLTDDFKVFTDKKNVTRIQQRKKRSSVTFSSGQLAQQQRFKDASDYAKLNIDNSFYIEEGKLRKMSAFQMAVSDYLKTPSVQKLVLSDGTAPNTRRVEIQINHCCLLADLKIAVKDNDDNTLILVAEETAELVNAEKNKYELVFDSALLTGKAWVTVDVTLKTVSGQEINLTQKNLSAVSLNSSVFRS